MSRRMSAAAVATLSSALVALSVGGCSSEKSGANTDPDSPSAGFGGSEILKTGAPQSGNGGGIAGPGAAGEAGTGSGGASAGGTGRTGLNSGGTVAGVSRGGAGAGAGKGGAVGGPGSVGGRSGTGGASTGPGRGATGGAASGHTESGSDVLANIHNGGFWNDVDDRRIEAHGGGFILVGDTWYWIGEDKSGNSGGFKSVNCYSSKDLEHWKFENDIITKATTSDLATAGRIIERPKVIYNDSTKQFVMWVHWEGNNYADAKAGVFTSSTVCGDYTYKSAFRPNDNMSRDDTLFKDDDGKAYFLSAANENADLVLYELSADYLTVERQVATLWAGSKREAPALFKQDGRYYLITSACTGWDSNQAQYASATAIGGPWTALKNIGNSTTFDTQATYVIPVVGSKTTTYVYASDRWQDPDLVSSKYIWLPLKLSGTTLSMDFYEQWQLNLTTGEWNTNDGMVPQGGWKLIHTDSEETEGENGRATNAFDNSASTFWHTAYTGTTPAHPHEIQIDLSATYAIQGLRALPRQDKDDHGIIARYEFYASEDASNWGNPVATGTFDATRTGKTVSFPRRNAHYVRLVALSEINGGDWASLAELDLVPAP